MNLAFFPDDLFIRDKEWEKKVRSQFPAALREAEAKLEERNESIRNMMSNIPPIGMASKATNQANQTGLEGEADQESNSDASTQEDQFDADLSSNNSV